MRFNTNASLATLLRQDRIINGNNSNMKRLVLIRDDGWSGSTYLDVKTGKTYLYSNGCIKEVLGNNVFMNLGNFSIETFDRLLSKNDTDADLNKNILHMSSMLCELNTNITLMCSKLDMLLTHFQYAPPAQGGTGFHEAQENYEKILEEDPEKLEKK